MRVPYYEYLLHPFVVREIQVQSLVYTFVANPNILLLCSTDIILPCASVLILIGSHLCNGDDVQYFIIYNKYNITALKLCQFNYNGHLDCCMMIITLCCTLFPPA